MDRDNWETATATVHRCGLEKPPGRSFLLNSVSGLRSGHYLIEFSYEVDGNHLSGEFNSSSEWKEGSTFPLKYNPQKPEENDREDEGGSPVANDAAYAVGIALVALYFWLNWLKSRR